MRLFLYYAAHTFKNQLKKIFKSWVLIFILACALVGGLIGFTAAKIGSMVQDRNQEVSEQAPEEEIPVEAEADASEEAEEDDGMIHFMFGFNLEGVSKIAMVEFVIAAVILLILVLQALSADKSGAKIFLPADVNLLFSAPMKPQAVLLFRQIYHKTNSISSFG